MEEARTNRFIFTDAKPQCMRSLGSWLYSGKLYDAKDPGFINAKSQNGSDRSSVNVSGMTELTDLWILGGRLGMPKLQNAAIDVLYLYFCETGKIYTDVVRLYSKTVPGSRLRALVVEQHVYRRNDAFTKADSMADLEPYFDCKEFFFELLKRFSHRRNKYPSGDFNNDWERIYLCRYHVHEFEDCNGKAVKKATPKVKV